MIAQELENIIPELVKTEANEAAWKSIEYSHLVPVLIEAIKELNADLNNQKMENNDLRSSLKSMEARLLQLENHDLLKVENAKK